jgi:ethanolamine ammonia-lyase small subunit
MRGVCKKCGVEHLTPLGFPACAAHAKKTGQGCRANPVRGATVCSKHGAQAGPVKRKAAERVARQKVARTLGDLLAQHDKPDQHPYDALLEVTRGMGAVTRLVQQRLAALSTAAPDDETQAALALYRDHARALAAVAKTVIDANLEERLIQIKEAETELLFRAVLAAMRRADLNPAQVDALRVGVAEELRALRPA